MAKFEIAANGVPMGVYPGETPEDAVLAYVRDAGYPSVRAAAETMGKTEAAFRAEIDVQLLATQKEH